MARFALFLLLAVAALTQAAVPTINQNAARLDAKEKPLCDQCEKIIDNLKKIVDNPKYEQDLVSTLTKVCNFPFLAHYKDTCLNVVNDLVVVIHELQAIFDNPQTLCTTLELCEKEGQVTPVTKRMGLLITSQFLKSIHDPAPSNGDCEFCMGALNQLKTTFQNKQLMDQIESYIHLACTSAGPTWKPVCDSFVHRIWTKFTEVVVDLLCSPQEACKNTGACPNASPNSFVSIQTEFQKLGPQLHSMMSNISSLQTMYGVDFGCMACEASLKALLTGLTNPKVESTLAQDITNLACKIMPKSLQAGCFDFMNIYGVAALQVTFTEWTPKEICQDLHACKAQTSRQMALMTLKANDDALCSFCKSTVGILGYELQNPALAKILIDLINSGCVKIPWCFKDKCTELANEFIVKVLTNWSHFLSRADVCTILHMC